MKEVIKIKCLECGIEIFRTKKEIEKTNKHFCSRSCSAKYNNKHRILTLETKNKISQSLKKFCLTNDYKKIKHLNVITKICPICNREFNVFNSKINKIYCSRDCFLKDKNFEFSKKPGGLRSKSGRGKQGWYKGYWCDSSWELAFVIYNLDHDIKFVRNKEGFEYEFVNKKYKYYPDFILEDGTYIEIKAILNKKNKVKVESFNKKLIIIDKKGMQQYIDYVVEKYGKNFIELYEGNPHNEKLNSCLICGKPAKNLYCSRKCSGIGMVKRKLNKDLAS